MTIQRVKNRYAADQATRLSDTPLDRELVIQGSDNTLWRGDGVTPGGVAVKAVPSSGVQSVVAGTGVTVNVTDPRNPVVSVTSSSSGTVTSVGFSAPSVFTVTGVPITTAGTITLGLANEPAMTVFAGPISGSAAAPSFRALYDSDIAVSLITDQSGVSLTDQSNVALESNSYGFSISWATVTGKPTTLAGYGITDAVVKMGDLPYHPPFTTMTVPSAGLNPYRTVTITNLAEGARICWSDGVNWRRISDNSIAV